MTARRWMVPAAGVCAFVAAAAVMGRAALGSLGTHVINDRGDPVLNTAILAWNARRVPWSDAWYQFPNFYPLPEMLTLSEHLLGLSVIATPLTWLTGSALAAYNLTLLLTFPLAGAAMFLLVRRLTGSAGAALVAGAAFAFAPYRLTHVAHLQALMTAWAPLALLGLHAYLDTGRRRWLALFAAAWLLQGLANGYYLVYFSLFVGLWVIWFVVAQRRWRDLAALAGAGLIAALPLVPLLLRFVRVHERHGFSRPAYEIAAYGADMAGLACAPGLSTLWGWLTFEFCQPESALFPGPALAALLILGVAARGGAVGGSRGLRAASALLLVAGAALTAVGVALAAGAGPWQVAFGPLQVSASTAPKPLAQGMLLIVGGALLSPALQAAARRGSIPAFYALAAVLAWALAWGPEPRLFGAPALPAGPFAGLMLLPGVDGLRVPARFWMITLLGLAVVAGFAVAGIRRPRVRAAVAAAALAGLLADGWGTIPVVSMLPGPPRPDLLRGAVVLRLPLGEQVDVDAAAELDAVLGGWRTVNGYSGYFPTPYLLLRDVSALADPLVLASFLARTDLAVIVPEQAAAHVDLVRRQPGAELRGSRDGLLQFHLPRQGTAAAAVPGGTRLPVAGIAVTCEPEMAGFALDGDAATRWHCGPQTPGQQITADLGAPREVGAVVPALGRFYNDFPRGLAVETSVDGDAWDTAWQGDVRAQAIEAALADPVALRVVVPFRPRPARYVRLRPLTGHDVWYWSIAELELWSGEAR